MFPYIYIYIYIYTLLIILINTFIIHAVTMQSRIWVANLLLIIGVSMLIIGLSVFGAGLFLRRRRAMKKTYARANVLTTREAYSNIDQDYTPSLIARRHSVDGNDGMYRNGDKYNQILEAKIRVLEGRAALKALSEDQIKYNKLVVANNIKTHDIIDGKMVYTMNVIFEYPNLLKHLTKLHKIQSTIDFYSTDLDRLVVNPNKANSLMYRHQLDNNLERLIANQYKFKMNLYNKQQMGKKSPVYKGNLENFKGKPIKDTNAFSDPTDAEIHKYLSEETVSLRREKLELETLASHLQFKYDNLEKIRLKL